MATRTPHGDMTQRWHAGVSQPAAVLPCTPGVPPAVAPTTRSPGGSRDTCRRCTSGLLLLWLTLLGLTWGWGTPAVAQGVPGGTVLINETFQDAVVLTPGFTALGSTCLTGAAGPPPAGAASIPDCAAFRIGPVPPLGGVPGYLQLTDGRSFSAGALLYNRPIPASAGLLVTFDLWQYGGTGADGISFFLVDGTTELTQLGASGGGLGYTQGPEEAGIPGGALGFGFDAWGNFYNDNFAHGTGCPPERKPPFPTARVPNTITLRGPGDGAIGYCYQGSTTVPGTNPPQSSLPGSLRGAILATAARHVQITIQPATGGVAPHVAVAVDFQDGQGLQAVLDVLAPPGLPLTYKFGWVGSSGRVNDVHLLGNVLVSTLVPLDQLSLVTQVDHTTPVPEPLVVGSVVPYQFVVTNGGFETLTALQVQATTGSPVACPTTLLPAAPAAGSTVVCTGTATLTQADVDAGVLVTTATATARNPGNQPVTSAPSAVTLGVGETPPPRLTLQAFVVDSPPYTLGQMVTFQYQLTNESPVPLTNLQVTDEPVAGIGCVPGAPTTVCTGTHTLQASDLDAHGFFTHTAVGAGTAPDGTPVSAPPVTLSLPVGTDIAVAMQVEPPATEPDVVTYVVTATNQGALAATGVQVADVVPAGTTFVAATPAPGTTYDPGTGIWAIGPLARGATVPLRLQVRVTSPTPQPNQARLTALDQVDSDPTNNVAEDQPTFADLVVTTTVNQPAPQVGETVTFTVLVQNRGPQPATGVQLVGDVEAGLTLLTGTPSQGTVTAATREWAIGALAVGATATLLVTARVEEAGPLRTLASVSAADQHDPDLSTNTAGLDLSGQPAADLQVQTTVDQRTPPVGSPVTVTVTVTNAGPTAATGVQLTVPLPAGVQLVTATPSQGTYTAATGVWDVGALALGARGTLVVQVRVTQPGPLLLLATATAQEAADPVPSNDASGVVLNGQAADLQVRTTVDRPTPAVGDRITVTVTVTNAGPSAATGIEVTVNLPAGLSLQTATPAQGTYAAATGLWTVGALASSGGPARATLRLEGIVTRAGTLLVRATATTQAQTDPNPLNNQGTATIQTPGTPLRPPADANIPPEARDDTLATPVTGAVTLAVLANDRDRDGDRLTIVVLTQPPGGTVVMNPDRTLTYTPRPGVVGTETFTYTVSDGRGGTATGTVRFTVALPPVSPAPGSPVVPSPDHPTPGALGLAPPAGRKLVTAAGPLELAWRLVWLNPGNPVALATRVVDPLPPATTYIDGSVTCTAQGQSTVQQCAFEAAQNQIVYTGTLGPDPGVTTEEPALHAVVITFRTTVLPGVTQVTNQALAFWAPLGPTTERAQVDDMGQDPVASGTTFTNHDPTTLTLPGLACIFQQRLVALSPPAFSPDASGGDGGSGDDSAMDAGVDRQLVPLPGTDEVFALATPPDGARVAGTAVTLATLQVPGSGLVVSRTTTVTLANSQPGGPLALVEDPAQKAEGVATQTAAVLVTAPGVVVALTPASLASAETVQLAAVDPVAAPAPLPGAAVAPLVVLTLTSGRPAFSGPVWLRLPYPDAEPDGQVDGVAPARPVTALTVWHVAGLQGRWGPVPEARVIPDHQRLEVAITATGLYGVFLAADGRLGSAGTHAQAPVGARSAAAQGSGWQDIGVVTTAPLLLPWNTTTLPDGAYELRVLCATPAAAVAAGPAAGPATAGVGQSPGGSGGGGCSLRPGSGGARAAVLAVLGNLGLPLAVLLALRLWHWRRRWAQH